MKLSSEVSEDKLRGAFYTPQPVVSFCLDRIVELMGFGSRVRILEPSAGDGNFIEGIGRFAKEGGLVSPDVTCVEVKPSEASKCAERLRTTGVNGTIFCESFFSWASENKQLFDVVVGNPPYIRYQFVPEQDRMLADLLLHSQGHDLHGVSNFWIPFVLLSLRYLRPGGAFALVLPSEFLATVSGSQVRNAFVRYFESLRIDLFPRNTFPDILQDVIVVSGVKATAVASEKQIQLTEYSTAGVSTWRHNVPANNECWTRYLLSNRQWEVFNQIRVLPEFHAMNTVASITVSTVTGANDYFTVEASIVEKYDLHAWVVPLLPRTSDCNGIIVEPLDLLTARSNERKTWLLDFAFGKPNPLEYPSAAEYIEHGNDIGLPLRYKCRVRSPWYRVPVVSAGTILMAKRAHQHPRLLLNQAGVITTDTIYRGQMRAGYIGKEKDLVSGFHNSATLLSAEVEGRTYGGGVLELVPSEIARLTVPLLETGNFLPILDNTSRSAGGQKDDKDTLIDATDEVLRKKCGAFNDIYADVLLARIKLRERRFGI